MRSRALAAVGAAVVLAAALTGCGSGKAKSAPSASPSVAPYIAVPDGVTLTDPGTALKLGDHAVIGWHPRQDTVAALDVQVERVERTTFDKSFQGWQISRSLAATTPYFARVEVTNVSDTDLGGLPVPIWGQQDAGTLVQAQPFDKRTFAPCHPTKTPATFAPGQHVELCFVYLISPGQDLASVAFQPQDDQSQALKPVTWSGTISTKVKPPAEPKKHKKSKKSKKSGKSGKSGKKAKKGGSGQ